MTYTLVFTQSYNKRAARWLKHHPELRNLYFKTLQLLELNPHHPSLRLHALHGPLKGLHSVSINLSQRITLHFMIQQQSLVLVHIGHHDEVYG